MREPVSERVTITRDHFLYRRIASFEMEMRDGQPYVFSSAFRRDPDEAGLSVYVEGIETAEQARDHGQPYHGVARLSASVPLDNNMPVIHQPLADAHGHAEIMEVNGDGRKRKLARACSVPILPTAMPVDSKLKVVDLDD